MAKLDEKMQMIGSAIVSQAEQERKTIVDKANDIRDSEISAFTEQLIDTMFTKVQTQTRTIRLQSVRDKAQAESKARRELLTRREELTTSVFAGAKTQLHEYASSADYRAALLDDLKPYRDRWDHSSSTVSLREDDLTLQKDITALLPGCKVAADATIKIGGFKLLNTAAGILVDETLDSRLEDQKAWFLQTCGLKTI